MNQYFHHIPVALLLLCMMCKSSPAPAQPFAGNFKGEQNGVAMSASLTVQNNQLKGTIIINGQQATVSGTLHDSLSTGTILDAETHKTYAYTAMVEGSALHFNIRFPELQNQVVELVLQKEMTSAGDTAVERKAPDKHTKDKALIGLWRHTEVLSSGTGDSYTSFATDYYMEFRADGTVLSWAGKSAGGNGGMSIESGRSGASKGQWYTEGKTLFFVDPATQQKASTYFYAEPGRMMLSDGGKEKKVFERVTP